MAILRTDLERALDEIASQEEGMRFQGLAVVLGKKRWPELVARQRKKDLGLDAYAPAGSTREGIGKGLAASITPTLKKISADAKAAKEHFPDLEMLLFVTSAKVGNADRMQWERTIQKDHSIELTIIEREEIIAQMMMPENASLGASLLHLHVDPEPQVADLIERARRAADAATRTWARRTKGHPLIAMTAARVDRRGAVSGDVLSLEQIDLALSESRRIVLEGPAGRGKTTMLIQLAQRPRTVGTPFMVELPAWTSSHRGLLDYIAGMPAFQAEGLTAADLARIQQTEPFLFLLNGWNEIAESNSRYANDALREVERDFPGAGIVVATRTHYVAPPLPGALRLRLSRLRRGQRAAYLAARLGAKGTELRARIDADPSLDELTRTPFILSEVTSLFEAGAEIPSRKLGVLADVLRLQEQRDEHNNALQAAPVLGRQTDYLKTLAVEMTRRGAVALLEADARAVVATATRELADRGQLESVGAPSILATLTAHHVLERVDYPHTSFQFEHQQLQEYYAAIDVRARLLDLRDDDLEATGRFTADYVNDPIWAEPLRMIAEACAEQTGDSGTDTRNTHAGKKLVEMALTVDPVFAGELARLCGAAVWHEVRADVGERFRALYAIRDSSYRKYAIAAMLATGADDFSAIIVPLLSGQDQQTRLRTYRLWPDFQVSSLGPNWREQVRGWSEEARADLISELLDHRVDGEVVAIAVEDNSIAVKKAAAFRLMWTRSDDAVTRVLESMDSQTFEEVVRNNAHSIPPALRPKTIAAMRKAIESASDHHARLRTALELIALGEDGVDGVVKDALAALPGGDMRNLGWRYVQAALEHLRKTDPAWASEWIATQIAEGSLYELEYWLPFATAMPDGLVQRYLHRLETEDFKGAHVEGIGAVIAVRADAKLAGRIFAKVRALRSKVDAEPGQRHEFESHVMHQLGAVFRRLPYGVAAAGVISSVTSGNALDLKVAANLLSRVARSDMEPPSIADDDVKGRLRAYLKGSVALVLRQDDFNGEEKANLASSIAEVGRPADMADLMRLIRADIERMRRGRAARAAGDNGPVGQGGSTSYARWHVDALIHLDASGADQMLMDLLPEPEYLSDVAAAMARDYVPKREHLFGPTFCYEEMWAARERLVPPPGNDDRRCSFVAAINAEMKRLRERNQDGITAAALKELGKALAAIDGRGSAAAVLEMIAMPGQWDHFARLEAAERLLIGGVVLPVTPTFALVDSAIQRAERWGQDSDQYLLLRVLALCPFVDDPAAGIAKLRGVLGKQRACGYELRELIIALGESRSDAAVDLLYQLASDVRTFEHCQENFIKALAGLDTPRARELLLGLVDPDIRGITLTRWSLREDMLVARLGELARRMPEVAARLRELCERDLPELNRHVLSKVMDWLGTPEASVASLNLIDDAKPWPIPQGIMDGLQSAFVEHRPYERNANTFTVHARAANGLRVRLFKMALEDSKRRRSAFSLLGQIEEWRLEYGRPTDEPRHPDLASGQSWPPETLSP